MLSTRARSATWIISLLHPPSLLLPRWPKMPLPQLKLLTLHGSPSVVKNHQRNAPLSVSSAPTKLCGAPRSTPTSTETSVLTAIARTSSLRSLMPMYPWRSSVSSETIRIKISQSRERYRLTPVQSSQPGSPSTRRTRTLSTQKNRLVAVLVAPWPSPPSQPPPARSTWHSSERVGANGCARARSLVRTPATQS